MKNSVRFLFVALLTLLLAWLLLCTHFAGILPVKEILCRISLPVIIYMVSAVIFASFGRRGRVVFLILLCALALFEAALGVLQMLRICVSNNHYHILTGNFINQGLYGGLMSLTAVACVYEFIHTKSKKLKIVVAVVFTISFAMMLISVSRAAWIGFIVAVYVILRRETAFKINFRRKRNLLVMFATLVIAGAAIFIIKPESALARIYIWRMDCRAIIENPVFGSGSAGEVGAYCDAQESFFEKKDRPQRIKQLADSPLFAYNEFLKFGIQGGIPALFLSLSVIILAIILIAGKHSEYLYVLIAFVVFSLFSFPLRSITFCSILAVLLADASVPDRTGARRWFIPAALVVLCFIPLAIHKVDTLRAQKEWRQLPEGAKRYGKYYPELRYEHDFIVQYGLELYQRGLYSKALDILSEGAHFHSVSSFYCLMGNCYEMLGDTKNALKTYKWAMNLVPSRLMPYYMLMSYYLASGQQSAAQAYRQKALSIPYDASQSETVRIRKMIEDTKIYP